VIEQLESDKLRLTAELASSKNQMTQVMESKELVGREMAQLRSLVQASETDRQLLQQQMQNLRAVIEYLKDTTIKSVDEFTDKLKLDLDILVGNQ